MVKTTCCAQETMALGKAFARTLKPADVVVLEGELGGGKTTFIKGVLRSLGYKNKVLSPTFTLIRRYQIKKITVCHIDLYRLDSDRDFFELGFEDIFYQPEIISLVEWGQKVEAQLARYVKVTFIRQGLNERKIIISNYP